MTTWIVSFLTAQIIPVTFLAFGYYYKNHVPKTMKSGYRTRRSTRSRETWVYAHRLLGRLFRPLGWITLPLSFFGMFAVLIHNEPALETASGVFCLVQAAALLGVLIAVERALRKNFDETGYPNDAEIYAQCREDEAENDPRG